MARFSFPVLSASLLQMNVQHLAMHLEAQIKEKEAILGVLQQVADGLITPGRVKISDDGVRVMPEEPDE